MNKYIFIFIIIIFNINSCIFDERADSLKYQKEYLDKYSKSYFEYNKKTIQYLNSLFSAVEIWKDKRELLAVIEYKPSTYPYKTQKNEGVFLFLITSNIEGDTIVESYYHKTSLNEFVPIHFREGYLELDSIYFVKLPIKNDFNYKGLKLKTVSDKKSIGIWEKVDNETHKPLR